MSDHATVDHARDLPDAIDARAAGLGPANAIFVFGTRMPEPAHLAAGLYVRGLAPIVVVTGGGSRQSDGLIESHQHRDVLITAGVPGAAIVVEDRSSHTAENISFAMDMLEARGVSLTTVIAVVKRHHRRAVVTLAHRAPALEQIFVVDYAAPCDDDRIARELAYLSDLAADGVDLLVADGNGWRRSAGRTVTEVSGT
jgi:uncharacterized SAM-binding protein YcdF (DUF218 family)